MTEPRKAAKYLAFSSLLSKTLSFVFSIILARILIPDDYGYLLLAMIFTGLIRVFEQVGFESFYLQEKINDQEHENNILAITFILRIITNSLLFIAQFYSSYWVAEFYDSEIVGELLRVFSFNFLITAFMQVNLFVLRKRIQFKPEALGNVARDVLGGGSKVVLAIFGYGALSFAIGSNIGNIVKLAVILKYYVYKPQWGAWDKKLFKRIVYFGKHSFIGGIGMFLSEYMDKILLSKFFPHSISGLYYFANNQSLMFSNYLISPQSSLVMAYSAKHKDNIVYLNEVLRTIAYLIAVVSTPIIIFLFMFSDPLFDLVFGEKWNEAVPLFKIFLISSWMQIILFPISTILTSFGYPQIASKIVLAKFLVLASLLLLTVSYTDDILTYATVFVFTSVIFILVKAFYSLRLLHSSLLEYFHNLRFGLVVIVLNIIIFTYIRDFELNVWSLLSISAIASFVMSIALVFWFNGVRFLFAIESLIGSDSRVYKYVHSLHNIIQKLKQ